VGRRRLVVLGLITLLGSGDQAGAWGFAAHKAVNRGAVATLPEPMAALFRGNVAHVAEHAIDPDLWRTEHENEGANHFLDVDAFDTPPFDRIPRDETEFRARFGSQAGQHGRLPWRVGEAYRDLVAAFEARDPARVLTAAAILGHYVADAHVPFHATRNHDGQMTGQTGIHARWESDLFEHFERQISKSLAPLAARPAGDPVALTFDVLRESYAEVEGALASDRDCAGALDFADTPQDDRYDAGYYSKLYEREGPRITRRFQDAVSRVGSLWLTAWIAAGRPELDGRFRIPYPRKGSRAVLLTLDGASAALVDDGIARGLMPHLAQIRAEGAAARGSLTALPAKTAAGHAALFTGAWSDRNGISGTDVPLPGGTVVESVSGFSSAALLAEPIWVTAARQGLDVAVVSATQSHPFAPFLEERRFGGNFSRWLTMFDGFRTHDVAATVYTAKDLPLRSPSGWRGALAPHRGEAREFHFLVDGVRIDGLLYDDPADPVDGFDTMALAVDKRAGQMVVLKPQALANDDAAFGRVVVHTGDGDLGCFFRLFALSKDASEILLYRSTAGVLRSNRPLAEQAAFAATGGFTPNGGDDVYRKGGFGPPLWKGGDGTAERRYLETARLVSRQFVRLFDFGADRTRWDLLIAYLPYPDEALHTWWGFLDTTLPVHDPGLAARLRPFLDEVFRVVDEVVGHVRERAGSDTILAVASDHGMAGVYRAVNLNVVLQKAGLEALKPDGAIDLSRSRAVYFPGNSGFFLVNRTSRPRGIVRPEEEDDVLGRLAAVLLEVRDPDTGQSVVRSVADPRRWGREPAIGGPQGGDLYVDLAPGFATSAVLKGNTVEPIEPRGEHLLAPERPELLASFAIEGPGVSRGVGLDFIRQVDIAPTLAALLGIPPPSQSVGGVLCGALARIGSSAGVESAPSDFPRCASPAVFERPSSR
jgi:predicted AlkP superfamily phosphohydrolase/phosphomutase